MPSEHDLARHMPCVRWHRCKLLLPHSHDRRLGEWPTAQNAGRESHTSRTRARQSHGHATSLLEGLDSAKNLRKSWQVTRKPRPAGMCARLRDLLGGGDSLGPGLEARHHVVNRHADAPPQVHRVQPRRDALAALAEDGARQHRRRRRACKVLDQRHQAASVRAATMSVEAPPMRRQGCGA